MSEKDNVGADSNLELTDRLGEVPSKSTKEESFVDFLKELPGLLVIAFLIALILRTFVFQTTIINQDSMRPNLSPNDRTIVLKFIYRFTEPKPGDVIILVPPHTNDGRDFVKRIVAVEGDTIQVKDGKVYVNGRLYIGNFKTMPGDYSNCGPLKVPEDNVFVLGDNRPISQDSRWFGPVPEKNIIGKVVAVYWPPNHLKLMH
ncbi:MAG: signal peptidase I [Firmicutes bacterium]|nr:signal peptidase I [Bacillota bacterium]